jgi:hypothetical protein
VDTVTLARCRELPPISVAVVLNASKRYDREMFVSMQALPSSLKINNLSPEPTSFMPQRFFVCFV